MSAIHDILEGIIEITVYDLDRIEVWLQHRRRCHPFRPAAGRFSGFCYLDPRTGVEIVATQTLVQGVAYTAPLVFTDASGVTGAGPMGEVSASDPSISIGLSADGQACNVTGSTAIGASATLTWHDPTGVVPDFTLEVEVVAPVTVFQPTAGSFGTFAEGTTA